MSKQFYSEHEQVIRLWDAEQVKDLMNRHSFCLSRDQRRRELNELWVKKTQNRRTASLGLNNGYYVGMDEISNYYVVENEALRMEQLKPFCQAESDTVYDHMNIGLGIMNLHALNTPVCYIADDGQTARYMAFDQGIYTVGHPDGTADAYHTTGVVYADLIKEDGEWKIWHLIMQHDHSAPAGKDYGEVPIRLGANDDPVVNEFGTPTIPQKLHDTFLGWENLYQDMPKPYYCYNDMYGYGANGAFGMSYFERERRER